ncbi:MAG: type II toxin-antitoxin system PemK/MazF family toxin [Geobacteraceae bacterium]
MRTHVPLEPPEGGVREKSFIKCEDVRSISTERLKSRWGEVSPATMGYVEDCLRIFMGV